MSAIQTSQSWIKNFGKSQWSNFGKTTMDIKLHETRMLIKRIKIGKKSWKKDKDLLVEEISSEIKNKKLTKRIVLLKLASIYDPFRIT